MSRRKDKIPRITFGPANPINLTDENWRKIEKAYGRSFPNKHANKLQASLRDFYKWLRPKRLAQWTKQISGQLN